MPTYRIFNKQISLWVILAALAAIGGGVWYYIHHKREQAKKKADDASASALGGATKVETPKTEKQTLYVPGAGQVTLDVAVN